MVGPTPTDLKETFDTLHILYDYHDCDTVPDTEPFAFKTYFDLSGQCERWVVSSITS